MRVVVTGATGLIGRALQRRLQHDGHEVVGLTRSEWNGERDIAPAHLLKDCDAIVHLAGENIAARRWTRERKSHLISSRVTAAKNLKLGLEKAGVHLKIFISASAVGIFGDRGDEVLNEDSTAGSDFLAELCQAWEAAADSLPCERTVKVRFGVVISKDGGFLEQVIPMFKRFGASRLGHGRQWLSWIHIDDAVEVIAQALLHKEWKGAINVVAPHPVTNAQLTQELKSCLSAFTGPPVPAFALRCLYGELAQALLSSQRVIPQKLEHLGFRWKYRTLKEALEQATSGPS